MGKEADQFEKKCVFNLDLKDDNDGQFLMSSGMFFPNFRGSNAESTRTKGSGTKRDFQKLWFVERIKHATSQGGGE